METLLEEEELPTTQQTNSKNKHKDLKITTSVRSTTDAQNKNKNVAVSNAADSDSDAQRASLHGTKDEKLKPQAGNKEVSETETGSHTETDTDAGTRGDRDNQGEEQDRTHEPDTEDSEYGGVSCNTINSQETDDVLNELPRKSAMLEPIPEPDYSDLADREKLFPRPVISNPKVAYELACRQLGVVPISQYLRSLDTYAEELHLQSRGLARQDMLPLCHSLAYNTTATSLNLSQNRLRQDVLPNIQAMMNDNSFIGSIDLSRNNLTGPGLRSLPVLLGNNYTLTALNLSHCKLLDSDAPALAAVIEASLNLRTLGLAHNSLSECGKLLGGVLAEDEGLETLDLAWNTLRSRSARELLLGLRKNSRLRRLDLAWNSLGPDTATAIRDLLKKNAALAELDVSHNRLSDAGMRPIGLGLSKNSALEKFWIGHNPVTPVGALALMRVLPKAGVSLVDMSQIEVSSDFVKLRDKLDPDAITVVHGTVNKDMVLIVPTSKKKRR